MGQETATHATPRGILIEAEDFEDYGGWLLDSQFEAIMGSPYRLAHGPLPNSQSAATC